MMMDETMRFVLFSMLLQSYIKIIVKTNLFHEELIFFEGDSISAMWPREGIFSNAGYKLTWKNGSEAFSKRLKYNCLYLSVTDYQIQNPKQKIQTDKQTAHNPVAYISKPLYYSSDVRQRPSAV